MSLGETLEAIEKPKAKERERIRKGKQAGAKCGKLPHLKESKTRDAVGAGGSGGRGKKKPKGKFPQGFGRTADAVGAGVGMSGKTYERAKAVAEHGEGKPSGERPSTRRDCSVS